MPEEKKDEQVVNAAEQEQTKADDKVEAKSAAENITEAAIQEKPRKPTFLKNLNYLADVREDIPTMRPGDVVRVSYRVIEGGKERIQVFEGIVIAQKNYGISKTVTVRKTSFGIAVERIFPVNSKLVQGIEVKKHSKVRRSKLYYLRELKGKAARLRELR